MYSFAMGLTPRRQVYLLMAMACCFFFQGCDTGQQNAPKLDAPEKALAFRLEWPQRNTVQAEPSALKGDVCTDFMIEFVIGSLYDAHDALISTVTWECITHKGTIRAPYGSGYRVVIQGIVAGNGLWQGQAADIDVIEGITNDPITIGMAYTGDDVTPPSVSNVSPENGATGIPTATPLIVTLSEPIIKGSMDERNFSLLSDSGPHPCDIAFDSGNQSVTITPRSRLAPETNYRAHIAVNADTTLQDMAGNPMTTAFEWEFTTGRDPSGPPVVQSVSPGYDTTVVSLTPHIEAVFDQPMDLLTMVATNMILYDDGNDAVTGQVTYIPEENGVVFKPLAPLQVNTTYTVMIAANVSNTDGVQMGADYSWRFTTTGSSLALIQPSDGVSVPCDNVQFEWSEVTGAAGYHLQVASDSTFLQILTDDMVAGTRHQLSHAAIGTNYWRVRARDLSQNNGAWSAVGQFNGVRTLWFQRFGSPGEDNANGLAIAQDDGILITGRTWGVIGLPGSSDTYDYQGGSGDVFLLKLDAQGNGVWLENLGTGGADAANGVTIDASNDIYITGFSEGDFGAKQTADSQILLSRFSSNGNLRWTRQFGESRGEYGEGISTHGQDDTLQVLITGYSDMPLPDIPSSGENIFLAKYNAAGDQVSWMLSGTASMDRGYSVLADANGNAIISGGEDGHLNVFSFAPDGQRNWTADLGQQPDAYPYVKGAIAGDNIYVTGTQVNPPSADRMSLICKINATDGQQAWMHLFQITADEYYEYGEAIAADQNGAIYVAGIYYLDSSTSALYVSKFEPVNGDLLWTETFGGGTDAWQYGFPEIKTDSQGHVIVTAYSFEAYQSYATYEIFVWKLAGRDQ